MAQRPKYAAKKSPVTGTVELGERVATTGRDKKSAKEYAANPRGGTYRETGDKANYKPRAKKANADPRMPAYRK